MISGHRAIGVLAPQLSGAYLINHGHQGIAFVGDLSNHDIKQRYAGYEAALSERGIAFDPDMIFPTAGNYEENGASVVRRLLDAALSCTAVAAATDETALGVLSAAQAAGYHVPEDLAIVGFDAILLAHGATPPLMTIRLPIRALGSAAPSCCSPGPPGRRCRTA